MISHQAPGDTVLLHRILGLGDDEEVFLAEESLEGLIYLPVTSEILLSGLDADKMRMVEISGTDGAHGTAVALHLSQPEDLWLLLTDKYSEDKVLGSYAASLRDNIDGIDVTEAKVSEGEFLESLIEYFSRSLAGELLCESCHVSGGALYVQDRIDRLENFLKENMPEGESVLEVGCGSGMATQSLLRRGYHPWSLDYDKCDLCQGLKSGSLSPERAFVLDGRMIDRFFRQGSFDIAVGFMVGMINGVNWSTWKDIILRASGLAKNSVLYTVYTRKEADIIAVALKDAGWDTLVIDNRDPKGIYDQWACRASRGS